VTATAAIAHFWSDFSGYIPHFPHLAELMKPLDWPFHRVLIRSMLSCLNNSSGQPEILSITTLIRFSPAALLSFVFEALQKQRRWKRAQDTF
jgi:hypothetical protein